MTTLSVAAAPLKRSATIAYGLGQPPPLSDDGVPIIRATNIKRGRIVRAGLIRAALENLPLDRVPLLKESEILVVRSGAYTGDSAIVTKNWTGCAPGYDLRITPKRIEPRYLAYFLLSRFALDFIALASNRAAQPHLNADDLGELPVPLISLSEQRRIADFLDTEIARLDNLSQLRLRTRIGLALRRDILIESIINGENAPLRKIFSLLDTLRDGTHLPPPRVTVGVPLLTARNVSSGELKLTPLDTHVSCEDATELERSFVVQPTDVLMSVKGTVGAVGIVPHDFPRVVLDRNLAILRPGPSLLPEWLLWSLRHRPTQEQISLSMSFSAQPGLTLGAIRELRISLPDLNSQRKLTKRIELINLAHGQLISTIDKQLSLLAERRQALITAAVTGQFDVSSASGRGLTEGVPA